MLRKKEEGWKMFIKSTSFFFFLLVSGSGTSKNVVSALSSRADFWPDGCEEPMRSDAFIHFYVAADESISGWEIYYLFLNHDNTSPPEYSGAIARISVESVGNSWSVFRFLTIVMNYVGRWVFFLLLPPLCVVNIVIVLRKANMSGRAGRFLWCVFCLWCNVSWCIVVCCPLSGVFVASVTIVVGTSELNWFQPFYRDCLLLSGWCFYLEVFVLFLDDPTWARVWSFQQLSNSICSEPHIGCWFQIFQYECFLCCT